MSDQASDRKVRTFVALELPAPVRAALGRWSAAELTDPGLRAVATESLHLTMVFLGGLGPEEVRRAAEVVYAMPANAIPLRFEREPVALPRRGPKKCVHCLEVSSVQAVRAQSRLERDLAAAGLHEPEREFWPHVTVARVRAGKDGRRGLRGAERRPGALPDALLEPFDAVRLTLYLSQTKSAGVEYEPLAQVELPPGSEAGQQ